MSELAVYFLDRKTRAEFPDALSGFIEDDREVLQQDNAVVKQGQLDGVPTVLVELDHVSIVIRGEDPNAFASNWTDADFAEDADA